MKKIKGNGNYCREHVANALDVGYNAQYSEHLITLLI